VEEEAVGEDDEAMEEEDKEVIETEEEDETEDDEVEVTVEEEVDEETEDVETETDLEYLSRSNVDAGGEVEKDKLDVVAEIIGG
jgi:hypothetical protein